MRKYGLVENPLFFILIKGRTHIKKDLRTTAFAGFLVLFKNYKRTRYFKFEKIVPTLVALDFEKISQKFYASHTENFSNFLRAYSILC